MIKKWLLTALFASIVPFGFADGDTEEGFIVNTEPTAKKQARMAWWKDARFGMFVHWGLYSSAEGEWDGKVYGGGVEWIQKKANVPADVYEKTMLPKFKPAPDFAQQWAELARGAGAKYVVFTTKHHEGFALHDSAQTEFDAKDVTGRDLVHEIVDALRAEDLAVGFYHSLWDWHHPDAPAGPGSVNVNGLSMDGRDLSRYVEYLHAQVNELTDGRYGKVDILWLDYSKNQFQGEAWGAKALVEMVRGNQPDILINNRLWNNQVKEAEDYQKYWFGDFTTPEQHIPATGIEGIDWETCDTLNGTWGWSKHATSFKTTEELIHRLVDAVSKGGNYLLNIGPMPDGTIDPTTVERFKGIGEWMRINGEAIYGTQAGPFTRLPWGRATSKTLADGSYRLYLHVFNWPENGRLFVPGLKTQPRSARVIGGGDVLAASRDGKVVVGKLLKEPVHSAATVIVLDFDTKPDVAPYRVYASTDGSFTLEPADGLKRDGVKYYDNGLHRRSRLEGWKADGYAAYPLQVERPGRYRVVVAAGIEEPAHEGAFVLRAGKAEMELRLKPTGGMRKWKDLKCGTIDLPAGEVELELKCVEPEGQGGIALSTIMLEPVK